MKSSKVPPAVNLKSDIKGKIKGRVAIVGIGNIMRADDGLGPKFIELAKEDNLKANLFDCGTAPENYIIPILSTAADTVILVDAADLGRRPGDIGVFDASGISRVSFSTHNPSPRLLIDLLKTGKDDLNIFVVSIQPKTTALGEPLSKEVNKGLNALKDIFKEIL